MKKKRYQVPTLQVVKLQHVNPLLQSSSTLNVNYDEEDWDA